LYSNILNTGEILSDNIAPLGFESKKISSSIIMNTEDIILLFGNAIAVYLLMSILTHAFVKYKNRK